MPTNRYSRTEVLSNLVKKMPPPLSEQTYFCVEQAVGVDLKNLPKTTKDELGIGFIKKGRNETFYTVTISDPSKYRDAYNKYIAPLFVTAANENNPLFSQNQSTDVQSFSPQEEQRNNSENQLRINTAAEISDVTTAFIQTNELDAMEQKIKDMDDLIDNFKVVLAKRSAKKSSKPYGMGTPYSMHGIADSQLILATISSNSLICVSYLAYDLISNFKSALSSQQSFVFKAMWDGNETLHHVIRGLDSAQSESLLNTVMGSSRDGRGKFITEYVNWLNDVSAIRAVLEEKQMG